MTSAPRSPSSIVQYGPASAWVKSRTRMPDSGSGASFVESVAGVDIVRCFGLPPEQRHVRHDSKVLAHRRRRGQGALWFDGGEDAPVGLQRARRATLLAEAADAAPPV